MVSSLVADYSYAFKQTFSSKSLFTAYVSILALRCCIPFFVAAKSLCTRVRNKAVNRLDEVGDEETYDARQRQHSRDGCLLYSVLPFSYFTGSYRLLNFKNFTSEVVTGLVLDFFFNALPLLFVQAINNATLMQQNLNSQSSEFDLTDLQAFSILCKFFVLFDCIVEAVLFAYEFCQLHYLKKQAINVLVYYTEAEKRRLFAKKLACRTGAWLAAILVSFTIVQLLVDKVQCHSNQAVEWSSVCQNCQVEYCDSC